MGLRLLAIDGSTLRVPYNSETKKFFGSWHPVKGKRPCPMARTSLLHDVLNHLTVDALMAPKEEGERSLAAKHLQTIGQGDLLLLDRGYPAYWLFAETLGRGAHFLARMKRNEAVVRDFLRTGRREALITLLPNPVARKICEEKNIPDTSLKLRILRFSLKKGIKVVLLTSLLDKERFPLFDLKALYTKRWAIEETYRQTKCRLEMENFSGNSPLAVLQDFHARILTSNLAAVLVHPVQDLLDKEQDDHPKGHRRQVNFTYALSVMKNNLVSIFLRPDRAKIILKLFTLLSKTLSVIRPGRRNPRKRGPKLKLYAMAYKPIA
jgi:hypothetical protein